MQRLSAPHGHPAQAPARPRTLGVTPPISTTPPTERELRASDDLVRTLEEYGQNESEDEARQREVVLGKIDTIFKEFVRDVSIKNGLPETLANDVGGKIFTFGSYRLGVHGKGSDIDTLCVAPKHVKREDFFEHMYLLLKSRSEVSEITAVSDAYVPLIKLEFSGIAIDLVFARLALPAVSEDLDLSQDILLKNLDERCVRSLNGSRVTDDILRLVPNVTSFRIALRCIKLWAKQRAIYSNVMGFFGGVAWAIVVARICQLYPNAAAAEIVCKFFQIMQRWEWPMPVLLKPIEEGPLAVRVWNPKIYPQDKAHRMPIITPAYPSMCSTHNVTASTQAITTQEFERASVIANRIMVGRDTWSTLFQKNDFFHRYRYYLQIIASSDASEKQQKWSGWVESRVRQLVMKLELVDNLDLAHPYIKGFEKVVGCRNEQERHDIAHGIMPARLCTQETDMVDAALDATAMATDGAEVSVVDPMAHDATAAATAPGQIGFKLGENGVSAASNACDMESSATVDRTAGEPTVLAGSQSGQTQQSNEADAAAHASSEEAVEQETSIFTITFYIGLAVKPRDPESNAPRKLDISWPISEFAKMVKSWDTFDESSMGLVIQHIRNPALPLDVFDESEIPQVMKKRSKSQRARTSTSGENPTKKMRAWNPPHGTAAAASGNGNVGVAADAGVAGNGDAQADKIDELSGAAVTDQQQSMPQQVSDAQLLVQRQATPSPLLHLPQQQQQQQQQQLQQESVSVVQNASQPGQDIVFGSFEAPVKVAGTGAGAMDAADGANGGSVPVTQALPPGLTVSAPVSGTTSPTAPQDRSGRTTATLPGSLSPAAHAIHARSYSEALASNRFGNGGLSGMGIQAPGSTRRAPEIRLKLAGQPQQ